jgi:hypothetical protein
MADLYPPLVRASIGITQPTVGHETRGAADHRPGHQNVAAGGGAGVAPAVDHDDVTGGDAFDRIPLKRVAAPVRVKGVHVFASRDEAHRERFADEAIANGAQRFHAAEARLPEPAPEQQRGQRRRADLTQLFEHPVRQCLIMLLGGHRLLLSGPFYGEPRRFRSGCRDASPRSPTAHPT